MLVCLLLTASLLLVAGDVATASHTRRICRSHASLYDSPHGLVIGFLRRHDRVRVLRPSANRRWYNVRARTGLLGWVTTGAVCRRG